MSKIEIISGGAGEERTLHRFLWINKKKELEL